MLDATTEARRFDDKPELLQIILDLPRPCHVSPEDYEAVLFAAPRCGDVVLCGDWWEDEPTPDLLPYVPNMPHAHLKAAIARYVELLFSRTHPRSVPCHPDPKTGMWDVICYLRRRQRVSDMLARIDALCLPPSRPTAFSAGDFKSFSTIEFPRMQNQLRERLIRLRDLPFSHEGCGEDRAEVAALLEEEAMLNARLFGLLPPWKSHAGLAPDSPDWQYGSAATDLKRYAAYYRLLTPRQRLRLRKHQREGRGWQGWYASQELDMCAFPGEVRSALYQSYLDAPRHLPAHQCKQLADQFRLLTGEFQRSLIVFRGGSLVRVFSDIEMAAIREGVKSCVSFRKAEEPMTVRKKGEGWICGGCNLYRYIPKDTIPEAVGPEHRKAALSWLAFELLFRDALELHSVLLLHEDRFTNLEQKREFTRTRRRPAQSSPHAPGTAAVSDEAVSAPEETEAEQAAPSPLSVGGCVSHRVWGEGILKDRQLHGRAAFWTVRFSDGDKQLSEEWILSSGAISLP